MVKVETAAGDPQRAVFSSIGVRSDLPVPPFEIDNRGKRSIVLDLRDDADLERFHALLGDADVLVTNLRAGALERLGLDHDAVLERHPHLVYGLVTGYGHEGDERDRAGYDVGAYWARSGMANIMVPPGTLPPSPRSGMGDHQTGMSMAAGVVAKLLERTRTGRGGFVTTSLLRTGMYSIGWDLGIQLRFGRRTDTVGRDESPTPLVNSYLASDGQAFWLICLEGDRHWPKVVAATGRDDLAADDRFTSNVDRMRNGAALVAELDATFGAEPMATWRERFDAHDVWWSPVQSLEQVIDDPQAAAGFVEMAPRDGEEPFRAVATPVDFGGWALRPGPVPRLGEHTDEVLAELDRRG